MKRAAWGVAVRRRQRHGAQASAIPAAGRGGGGGAGGARGDVMVLRDARCGAGGDVAALRVAGGGDAPARSSGIMSNTRRRRSEPARARGDAGAGREARRAGGGGDAAGGDRGRNSSMVLLLGALARCILSWTGTGILDLLPRAPPCLSSEFVVSGEFCDSSVYSRISRISMRLSPSRISDF